MTKPLPIEPQECVCAGCGSTFIVEHRLQKHCSTACTVNVAGRKWRARHRGTRKGIATQRLRSWQNTSRTRGWPADDEATCTYVRILALDPCAYCGGKSDEIDHIDPDGNNEWTNLTAICKRCNRSKMRKSLLLSLCRLYGAWYRERGLLESAL